MFTDPNTIGGIANGNAGALLVANGAGSDPSFSVNPGGAGQVLTSNGPGSNPSYQTLATGVPTASFNIDADGYPFVEGIFVEGSEFQAFDFGSLAVTQNTELSGHNEIVAVPNNPGANEFFNPLNYGLGLSLIHI